MGRGAGCGPRDFAGALAKREADEAEAKRKADEAKAAAKPMFRRKVKSDWEPEAKPSVAAGAGDAAALAAAIKAAAEPAAEDFFSGEPQPSAVEGPEEEEEEPEAEGEEEEAKAARLPVARFSLDAPIKDEEPAMLSPAGSYDNAREYAKRHCWREGSLAVYYWAEKFWRWNGRAYEAVGEGELKAAVYSFLDDSVKISDGSRSRFRPKPRHVSELLDGLRAGLALPGWAEPPMRLDTGKRAGEVLMFRNGLIAVATGARMEPTPKLWVHNDLGYDWNPEAACPEWLRFLEGIFPGDQEAKDCLEEFLGLSMTEDVSFQKGSMLIGVPRSGKGTTPRVCEWLTGTKSFISLDLDKWVLGENSGEPLIGKKVLAFATPHGSHPPAQGGGPG